MLVDIPPGCVCGSIGALPGLRLCHLGGDHHYYWLGDVRLIGVTSLIRAVWPFRKDTSAYQENVDNAQHRGVMVDKLIQRHVTGDPDAIWEAPEREDAARLFDQFVGWWDSIKHGAVSAQLLVHDGEVAGAIDIVDMYPGYTVIYDVKCKSQVEATDHIQLGGYSDLYGRCDQAFIVQLNKKFVKPQIREVKLDQAREDWRTSRNMYMMAKRRTS